jgi:hydrogenase-4 component F
MQNHLLTVYIIVPLTLVALFSALGKPGLGHDNRFLNLFVILQAAVYLCITIWAAAFLKLPLSFLQGEYFYIDSLSLYEILITNLVFLLAAVYARGYVSSLVKSGELDGTILRLFYGTFCLLELVIVLAFASNNLALLWIFAELSTLLSAALIVTLKARENIIAALKYVFVASTAMLFSFIGIILLFAMSRGVIAGGSLNWTVLYSAASQMDPRLFFLAFVFLFLGFAAKAGVAPFHTWVPTVYVRAPSVVAVVSGTVLNLGLYVVLRLYAIGHATGAENHLRLFLFIFGTLSMAVAGFTMLKRTNTKKIIAFSGVESVGLLLVAIGLGSPVALYWALFYMLAYSLVKSLLFFCAGIFHRQYQSNKYFAARDAFKLQPLASWGLVVGSAAAMGTPLFPVFLAKWNILAALAEQSVIVLFSTLLFLLLSAIGLAYFLIRMLSQVDGAQMPVFHTPFSMKVPIVTALVMLLFIGLCVPGWLSDILGKIVTVLGI